ncbi:hypothetical protein Holit_02889 [Hollandina sp. SP2]
MEFEKDFATEEQYRDYIIHIRYKNGDMPDMRKQKVMASA